MIENGCLVSDYAPGTPPDSKNFPPRNRIISGLSLATVVIEAGERSGALITASFAADQGREVFAVPGTIYAPQSVGTNRLIRQGAQPYINPEELLALLNFEMIDEQRSVRHEFDVEPFEEELLQIIRDEPLHVDDICTRCKAPVEQISSTLVMLELKGYVRQAGDMKYQAVMEKPAKYA
jgi:DNA processing protein